MTKLREELISRLDSISGVTLDWYKDTELLCVYYKGKEVAHFQTDSELDIRLSQSIIKREQLTIPVQSKSHLDRSKNSRWIVQRFELIEDLDELIRLVKLAIELR